MCLKFGWLSKTIVLPNSELSIFVAWDMDRIRKVAPIVQPFSKNSKTNMAVTSTEHLGFVHSGDLGVQFILHPHSLLVFF